MRPKEYKNDENEAEMKEDRYHKNKKTGQRTKMGRKCQKQDGRRPKN